MSDEELREAFCNPKPIRKVLREIYEKGKVDGRADAIDELFNAEIINGMTLKDVYEEAPTSEFDEGWNRCYEDFVEVAEQLKSQNN